MAPRVNNGLDADVPRVPPSIAYGRAAPFYDDWHWQSFWRECERPIVAEAIRRHCRPHFGNGTLLDVGCGTGHYLRCFGALFAASRGLDISREMLAVARRRSTEARLQVADARAIPMPDGELATLLCARMLSHLARPSAAFREFRRVLRRDGLLILTDVAAEHDYSCTRLPCGDVRIAVETYKHSFRSHLSSLLDLGFQLREYRLLSAADRPSSPARSVGVERPVSWIAVFGKRE